MGVIQPAQYYHHAQRGAQRTAAGRQRMESGLSQIEEAAALERHRVAAVHRHAGRLAAGPVRRPVRAVLPPTFSAPAPAQESGSRRAYRELRPLPVGVGLGSEQQLEVAHDEGAAAAEEWMVDAERHFVPRGRRDRAADQAPQLRRPSSPVPVRPASSPGRIPAGQRSETTTQRGRSESNATQTGAGSARLR